MRTLIASCWLFMAVTAAALNVRLAWDAVPAGTLGSVTNTVGYYLYAVTPADVQLQKIDVGLTTTNTVFGLTGYSSYKFKVTAYNLNFEESLPSNVITYTPQAPTVPGQPVANLITQTGARLSWAASVDDIAVTGYAVYQAGSLIGTTNQNAFDLTSLTPATAYSYTVTAYDANGSYSAASPAGTFTTLANVAAPPTVPVNVASSAVTSTAATLSWNASTGTGGTITYSVYRSGVFVGSTTSTAYALTGLAPWTGYTYRIRATDANGTSADSAAVTFTTTGDSTAPTGPASIAVSSVGLTNATASWPAATDNVGVSGYRLYRNGTLVSTTTSLTNVQTGLLPGTLYTNRVAAYDAAGNANAGASTTFTTTSDVSAPSAPVITAMAITATTAALGWTEPSDNVGVVSYVLYKSGVPQVTNAVTGYVVGGLTCATPYSFTVRARDYAGNTSVDSNAATFTTANAPPAGVANGRPFPFWMLMR